MGGGRRSGGGRPASVLNRRILLSRIESCKVRFPLFDDIVDYLRSNYRDYRGIKQRPFARIVQDTLTTSEHSQQKTNQNRKISLSPTPTRTKRRVEENKDDEDEDEDHKQGISRKRSKGDDESEQRLRCMEHVHLRKRQQTVHGHQSMSSSTASGSNDYEEDDGDGAISTSDDAIFEDKVEPHFDLMKSMLRSSYMEIKNPKPKSEEKILELEVAVENKVGEKIKLANEGNRGDEMMQSGSKKGGKRLFDGLEVKGKDGPMFSDLGGMDELIEELKKDIILPLYHQDVPQMVGFKPTTGILLHGPPGCGKSTLAKAIASETGFPFYEICATDVVSGVSGASEENIRELFSKAHRTAPSIVFIDEIDAIASKRENLQREMERRIVTQLMTCMDQSHHSVDASSTSAGSNHRRGYVLVIGATNRPDAVDLALRRPGRFDREFALGVPNEKTRANILFVLTSSLKIESTLDLHKIARATPGFVGADLAYLVDKACRLALDKAIHERKSEFAKEIINKKDIEHWWKQPWLPEELAKLFIRMSDFEKAIKMVQPSSSREGFSSIPDVKWEDVGGLDHLREEFDEHIVSRIKFPEDYEEYGIPRESGFLLYGPPGCGKTLIAKVVANEAGVNFIHITGAELLNKYVGESEQAVRTLFRRARTCSPCIVFFDEVDALIPQRGKEGNRVVESLVNQLLAELDGGEERNGVFVIGATNRPDVIDDAMLRPGRFGKCIYVPLPTPNERGLILKALARKRPVDDSVDLIALGQSDACENFSGADLSELVNEAAMAALREKRVFLAKQQTSGSSSSDCSLDPKQHYIKTHHFKRALAKVTPSVSKNDIDTSTWFCTKAVRLCKKA